MKVAGIVLIVLQIVAIIGGVSSCIANGGTSLSGGPGLIFELIGFSIFGIIGVILLIKDHNRKK